MTDAEKHRLRAEIDDLKAKLKWKDVSDTVKFGYALRIAELEKKLKGKN